MITTSGNHLFSFILFIAIGLVLWLRISVEATHYVSPDSEFYLKVAENIKQGKGLIAPPPKSYPFDQHTKEIHFSEWTAGYPAIIAVISWLTGTSVFVASKLLNIISLALIFVLLYRWVGSRAWFPFLYFCSFAMLEVFSYTWSEPVFLFFLLLLCYVIDRNRINYGRWFSLQLALILSIMFLLRYAGLVYFPAVGLLALRFIWLRKYNIAKQYFIALLLSSTVVLAYFYYNYLMAGHVTGGSRFYPERINSLDLLVTLFHGLLNAASIPRNYYFQTYYLYLAVMIFQLFLITFLVANRNLLENPLFSIDTNILWGFSIFYLIAIVILRNLSPFDGFDYRILSPFMLPLYLGLFFMCLQQEIFFQKTYKWITAFMLLSLIINLPKVYLMDIIGNWLKF